MRLNRICHTLFHNILPLSATIMLLASSCSDSNKENAAYRAIDGFAQGSTYHMVLDCGSDSLFNSISESLEGWFAEIDNSVSGYNGNSLISRFNRGEDLALDSIFIDNFKISKQMYNMTGGLFDPSAGPLFNIWGFGFKEGIEVTDRMIDSVKEFIGMNLLSLEQLPDGTTHISRADSRVQLNFNAVAQGYTCDFFAAKFNRLGLENYLIEVGGEIYCKGVNKRGEPWRVGVDNPVDGNMLPGENMNCAVILSNKGLVTSGNYRKYYVKDGKKYSHTINPIEGRPVSHTLLSATLVAETSALADALATYCMVLGLEKARVFLADNPQYQALLIYDNNGKMESFTTPGLVFESFENK